MPLEPPRKTAAPTPARKPCIVFLDDEPGMLRVLERVLQAERDRWEMVFTRSLAAAFDELASRPVDVLVSEVRLMGEDGVRLLGRVKREHPDVMRIVFSGNAHRDLALRLVPLAHQLLAKPFDVTVLREALATACRVRALVDRQEIREAAGDIDALPRVPRVFLELQQALADPRVEIRTVARIVGQDPALVARLLQVVNSAFFGLARRGLVSPVTGVEQAVILLGLSTVHYMVLASSVFGGIDAAGGSAARAPISPELLQRQSFLGARIAARMLTAREASEQAFVAALLRDVGMLVLSSRDPAGYGALLARARKERAPLPLVEREELGASHAEVGGYLLGLWGLPNVVVEAVANHHTPAEAGGRGLDVATAVHVADVLADELVAPANDAGAVSSFSAISPSLDVSHLQAEALADRLPAWRAVAAEVARRY